MSEAKQMTHDPQAEQEARGILDELRLKNGSRSMFDSVLQSDLLDILRELATLRRGAAKAVDDKPVLSAAVSQKWNDLEWRSWAERYSPAEYIEAKLLVELSTEREMHNAWRKRATEAEAQLSAPLFDANLRAIEERTGKATDSPLVMSGLAGKYDLELFVHARRDIFTLLAALRSRGGEGEQKP